MMQMNLTHVGTAHLRSMILQLLFLDMLLLVSNSSIVMQEHLPTMAELQQHQDKVDDSVEYARCVTFATQRPS